MESLTNRGRYLLATLGATGIDWRIGLIVGTQTGVHDVGLTAVSDLAAVPGVSIHTERLNADVVATEDDVNNGVNIDTANLAFAPAPGIDAQGIFVYHEGTGADSGRQLISVHTTGFPQPVDGGLNLAIDDLVRLR